MWWWINCCLNYNYSQKLSLLLTHSTTYNKWARMTPEPLFSLRLPSSSCVLMEMRALCLDPSCELKLHWYEIIWCLNLRVQRFFFCHRERGLSPHDIAEQRASCATHINRHIASDHFVTIWEEYVVKLLLYSGVYRRFNLMWRLYIENNGVIVTVICCRCVLPLMTGLSRFSRDVIWTDRKAELQHFK